MFKYVLHLLVLAYKQIISFLITTNSPFFINFLKILNETFIKKIVLELLMKIIIIEQLIYNNIFIKKFKCLQKATKKNIIF